MEVGVSYLLSCRGGVWMEVGVSYLLSCKGGGRMEVGVSIFLPSGLDLGQTLVLMTPSSLRLKDRSTRAVNSNGHYYLTVKIIEDKTNEI